MHTTLLSFFMFVIIAEISLSVPLESYNVDRNAISVSGFSAGANMAVQLHVSHSSLFMGVGVIAGGPYWCGQNSMATATNACMLWPNLINVAYLQQITRDTAATGYADQTSNLHNDRIFLLSGKLDTVVDQGVVKATEQYYSAFVKHHNIKTVYSLSSQHGFPTIDKGGECEKINPDFMNNCGYNAAFEILNHIYRNLKKPTYTQPSTPLGTLHQFDQKEFFASFFFFGIGLANTGYLFVPDSCNDTCRLHIVLHGCFQGSEYIQDSFVKHAGYNEVAALNDIILLYPQVKKNLVSNPTGCFDWWGYTGSAYASNIGDQIVAIRKMIRRVANV